MDPARRSIVMLVILLGAMFLFTVVYLLSGGGTPDPSPMP